MSIRHFNVAIYPIVSLSMSAMGMVIVSVMFSL